MQTSAGGVSRTVDGVKHTYRLDGSLIIAEEWGDYLCLYLYDAEGNPIGFQYRNALQNEEVFTTYWFEKNAQGDVIAIYTDGGLKVVWYEYDAWGNRIETGYRTGYSSVEMLNPFGYRGYYLDRETGLYYLNSRYYDPEICRFLSPDSIGLVTASPLGLTDKNLYAYCDNNPIREPLKIPEDIE